METRFMKKKLTAAYKYSNVRLVLNYSIFTDMLSEKTGLHKNTQEIIQQFDKLLEGYLSGAVTEEEIGKLRGQVKKEVESLTAYIDCFQIYEYVLNRLERKFRTLPETGGSDEKFAKRLMTFITQAEDSAIMNNRIQEIISQLPVRLTKQKFFSLVMEGLSVYIGSSAEALQDMMYILETESMTRMPEAMAERKELYELLQQLGHWNYRSLSQESFEEADGKLTAASEELLNETGIYSDLQDLINDLYVLILSKPHAVIEVREEEEYRSLLKDMQELFRKGAEGSEEFYDRFIQLEGLQEAYYQKYLRIELPGETEGVERSLDERTVRNIDRLLSGSSFAELEEIGNEEEPFLKEEVLKDAVVDRPYLEKTAGDYFTRLDKVFSEISRPVTRAVMAKVLSSLPVYFNSVDEISSYITGSLEGCLDEAEKETCKELLEELIAYETDLV